jgi:hypothetical protein
MYHVTMAIIMALAIVMQGCGISSTDNQVASQETTSTVGRLPQHQAVEKRSLDASNVVSIAVVSSVDTNTKARVRYLLESANIPCLVEGSVGDGVLVPKDDALRATKILKSDAATNKYWIEFPEETNSQSHEITPLRPH